MLVEELWGQETYLPGLVSFQIWECVCVYFLDSFDTGEVFDDASAVVDDGLDDLVYIISVDVLQSWQLLIS